MIRSAAKNVGWVTVVVDPSDYPALAKDLSNDNSIRYETREMFSAKALLHTEQFDVLFHNYMKDTPFSD